MAPRGTLPAAFGWLASATLLLGAEAVRPSQEHALAPEESRARIELDGPYEVQLVAAEPLVRDPVEVCWDERGRLFVAEMRDYPLGPKPGEPYLSSIQQLVDDDGDGRMDRALPFAENLDHVQGLLPHRGGLIATTRTEILFLRDTDGDGRADERRPLIAGFAPQHSQLQVSSPRWGPDGWVWFNNGLDSREIYPQEAPAAKTKVARLNFRWNPETGEIQPVAAYGQFGAAFDDSGNYFTCSNRNPIMFTVLPQEAVVRNPFALIEKGWEDIAPSGPESRVYARQITHTTSDAHAGTNTACSGVGVYRGPLMPELRGNVFVPDPTGQLITRYQLAAHGSSLRATRVGERTEFFRSTDEWCRPVNFTTGPDGAIYVCDIYRRYIDHARFFPEEFAKTHDLRAGENEGRIWRIVPRGMKAPKIEPAPKEPAALAKWLDSPIAWQFETATRLRREAGETVVTLFANGASPQRRILLEWAAGTPRQSAAAILALAPEDEWMTRAVLSASTSTSGAVLRDLLAQPAYLQEPSAAKQETVRQLASAAAAAAVPEDLPLALAALPRSAAPIAWWEAPLIRGFAEGLARSAGRGPAKSFAALLAKPPTGWEERTAVLRQRLEAIEQQTKPAPGASAPTLAQIQLHAAALPLLALRGWEPARAALLSALAVTQPVELQEASLALVRKFGAKAVAADLYPILANTGPKVQPALVSLLASHPQTALELFQRMERGELPKASVDAETRWRWQQDKGELGALATRLFGQPSGDRAAVLAQYTAALQPTGEATRGRELFRQICATCHRYGSEGAEVGPTLSDVKAKPPEALLSDILDPNRMFEARWTSVQLTTRDGRVLVGLISAESAESITLTQVGGARETIARGAVQELKTLDRSLMPVGLEGALTPAQMNDLLAFLRGP